MRAAKPFPASGCQRALAALVICVCGASSASAQRTEATADVGGIALRYADTLNAGAATVSGHALLDWGRAIADAVGTFSQFTSGGSSGQGSLSGSVFSPARRGVLAEVGAFAGGSAHDDGTRTGEVLANARLHFMSGRGEIFAGGGVGQASFGGGAQRILVGEFGASTQIQTFDATLTVSPIALDSVQYTDTQIALSWSRRNIDFGAQFGVRVGDQVTDLGATQRTWGSLNAVAWVKPRIAAVLSGGTYPIDPTQGFPGGRFLSASIRVARGARRAPPPLPPVGAPDSGGPIDAAAIQSFTWRKSGVNAVTLRAKAPLAQTVEISGDFSNWTPVRLSSAADRSWAVTLPLKSGTYQMNIRVNGGPWRVPPGLLSMADEFGGSVGLLIVE